VDISTSKNDPSSPIWSDVEREMFGCWFFIFMSKSHNDTQFGVGLDQPLLVHWKAFIVQAPNIGTASWDEQWPVIRSRTCLATRSSSVHDFYRSSFVCSNVHDYCSTCLRSSFLCGMISSPSFLKPSMVGEALPVFLKMPSRTPRRGCAFVGRCNTAKRTKPCIDTGKMKVR